MAKRKDPPESSPRKLGELAMIWRFALGYPGRIVGAALALIVAATATLAIWDLWLVIDKGFIASGGDVGPYFRYLLIIVPRSRLPPPADIISSPGWASASSPTSASRYRPTCSAWPQASSRKTGHPRSHRG